MQIRYTPNPLNKDLWKFYQICTRKKETNMKELKEQQKVMKEFLKEMGVDKLVIDVVLRTLETSYLQGKIDYLESKYAQNNKK